MRCVTENPNIQAVALSEVYDMWTREPKPEDGMSRFEL